MTVRDGVADLQPAFGRQPGNYPRSPTCRWKTAVQTRDRLCVALPGAPDRSSISAGRPCSSREADLASKAKQQVAPVPVRALRGYVLQRRTSSPPCGPGIDAPSSKVQRACARDYVTIQQPAHAATADTTRTKRVTRTLRASLRAVRGVTGTSRPRWSARRKTLEPTSSAVTVLANP